MCDTLRLLCTHHYRCESFNGMIRAQNIFSNKQSPSRDIATSFATLDYLRFIVNGGQFGKEKSRSIYNQIHVI